MKTLGHPLAIRSTLAPAASVRIEERPRRWPIPALEFRPPRGVVWDTFRLPIDNLPPPLVGLRIVQLTDLHFRARWQPIYDGIIGRLRESPPDLLLYTGDFVDNRFNPFPAIPFARRLQTMTTPLAPTFAIVGNHDDYVVAYEMRGDGATFLDGKRALFEARGHFIELIGLPGAHRLELESAFLRRLPPRKPDVPRIVLSHFPDHLLQTESLEADIILGGHTHGGQMCMPGGVPLIWHDRLPRRLASGVHRVGKTWLVVSRGLGATGLPFRAFCPPQIIELILEGN